MSPPSNAAITIATATTLVRARPRTLTISQTKTGLLHIPPPIPPIPAVHDFLAVPPPILIAPKKKTIRRARSNLDDVPLNLANLEPVVLESSLEMPTLCGADGNGDWMEVWAMLAEMDREARVEIGKRRAGVEVLRKGIGAYKLSLDKAAEARRVISAK